jgi:hypothetical protein
MMKSNPVALSDNQKKLIQQVRAEHDDLLGAIHSLEAALASAAPGREQAWGKQVLKKLQAVAELLDGHARSAEAADGLLAMVAAAQPRLLHRVERLRREHVDLLDHARSLQRVRSSIMRPTNCLTFGIFGSGQPGCSTLYVTTALPRRT